MGTGAQPSLWPNLPEITVPSLLIAGELDQKFMAINEQMVGVLGNGRFHPIPNAGHTTHLEQPALFQAAVKHFLRRDNE
jgi:2-succinyl-6-hydroxy-2,4-cyclohexadiene-1-carboxylate synthase